MKRTDLPPTLSRRRFLAGIAVSAASFASGCAGASSARRSGRVIVIGAGVSGLAAAQAIKTAGYSVTVLEARDRIGGRILTDTSLGAAMDLGASWIHGEKGNPVTKLCRDHGIETRPSDLDDRTLFDADGSRIPLDEVEKWESIIERAEEIAVRSAKDMSFAAALRRAVGSRKLSPRDERILENILAGMECEHGGSADRLAARYANGDEAFPGDDLLFPQGYAAVPRALARDLEIRLSEPVRAVSVSAGRPTVETEKARHDADAVVVTLPLGILKHGLVEFDPDLSEEKNDAIERLGTGVLNKVVLQFPEVFWPRESEFFEHLAGRTPFGSVANPACAVCHSAPDLRETSGFSEFVNMHPVNSAPVLVALTGGPFAYRLESWPDEKIRAEAMKTIRRMFGDTSPDPVGMVVSRWHADPWSRGAYPHVPVGATLRDFKTLSRPEHECLFFAGDATNEKYPSTVHGAILSGRRAAREVEKKLG